MFPCKHAHPARSRSFRRGDDHGTVGAVVRVLFVVPGHAGPHHRGVEVGPIRVELGHGAPVAVFLNAHERHLPVVALDQRSQMVPALGPQRLLLLRVVDAAEAHLDLLPAALNAQRVAVVDTTGDNSGLLAARRPASARLLPASLRRLVATGVIPI